MAAGASAVEMICLLIVSSQGAKYALHIRHAPDGFDDLRQVFAVAHLELKFEGGAAHVTFFQRYLIDVGFGSRDAGGHRCQYADPVVDFKLDLAAEQAAFRRLPSHRQPLLRLLAVLGEVTAILTVNHHAAPRA